MFSCPNCKVKLVRQKGPTGVFWHCYNCLGRTASIGSLRKVVSGRIVDSLWQKARSIKSHGEIPCPSCEKGMASVPVPTVSGETQLDICKSCQFIWFDAREFESLPPRAPDPPRPDSRLPEKARHELAIFKTKVQQEEARYENDANMVPDASWQWIVGALGMPVEHESSILTRTPIATWMLAIAVTVFSIVGFFEPDAVVMQFGLIPAEWSRYYGLTFVTNFFLHGGIFHLIGNMYFLLVFGDNVEDFLGSGKFLGFVLIATLVGDVAHVLSSPEDVTPCVGASGGISAVITFYALRFPRARLGILFWFRWIRLPALALFLFWLVVQFFGVKAQLDGHSNVSVLAHLGGALVGLLFWLFTRKR